MSIVKTKAVTRSMDSISLSTYIGSPREFVKNTDTNGFVLMDGVTPGGVFEINDDNTLSISEILSLLPEPSTELGLNEQEISSITQGASQDLEQALLANDAQPAKTVLALGYTNTGKVQGVSLGDGNVVTVYATGNDFVTKTPLYTEFMALGEPICFTGLSVGAIITSTEGFYGASEQLNGGNESPMPLLSLGLSFTDTFFYAFRNSGSVDGRIRVVNGALKSTVSLFDASGNVVLGQQDIIVEPWGYLTLSTDGNGEYRLVSNNKIMACIHARMSTNAFYDSRLIMPLTNDGITWPRSGFVSALYDNTKVEYYVRDGSTSFNNQGLSLITKGSGGTGNTASIDTLINGKDTRARIAFTTPTTPPSVGDVKAIWESGDSANGVSMVLMPDWSIGITWGVGRNSPRLTVGTLNPNTEYSFAIDFLFTTGQVKVYFNTGIGFTWLGNTDAPQEVVNNVTDLDTITNSGDFSLAGTGSDVGGLNPTPTNFAFDGTLGSNFDLYELDDTFIVSPGSPADFDGVTGANDTDYEPNGATRVRAQGLISANSGADSAGLEASPLIPVSAMSQIVAQPFNIVDNGDGGNSGVAIASTYTGTAEIYEWDSVEGKAVLAYTVPLNRGITQVGSIYDQYPPSAGLLANDTVSGAVALVGTLGAGYIKADVPITVVAQSGVVGSISMRSQNGSTTSEIACDDDETLMLGHTPTNIRSKIKVDSNNVLRKRVVDVNGNVTWEVA